MNDHTGETRRLSEPTLAFHNQPTLAVGTNDLARELFRQCASTGSTRGGARAQSSKWDMPTAIRPRPCGNLSSFLVCVVCLVLGVAAGHVVREGSAYAAGAAALGVFGQSRSAVAHAARAPHAPHTASTLAAAPGVAARGKDLTSVVPDAPGSARASRRAAAHVASSRKSQAQPAARAAPPIAMDALFVDFEPTFRVVQ